MTSAKSSSLGSRSKVRANSSADRRSQSRENPARRARERRRNGYADFHRGRRRHDPRQRRPSSLDRRSRSASTTNFTLHGIPQWAISVALERDGEIVAGMVMQVIRDEAFWAEGVDAFVNDRRLRDPRRGRQINDAVIGTGVRSANAAIVRLISKPWRGHGRGRGVRRPGSAAARSRLRCGRPFRGLLGIRPLQPWDIAANGASSMRARGGRGYVTDIQAGHDVLKSGNVLAANDQLHAPLAKLIKDALHSSQP